MTQTAEDIRNDHIALARLKPHPDNNKRHPARQIDGLRSSLRKFGQPRSIVVQSPQQEDGFYLIVAGHGVTQAADAEGWATLRADVLPASWPPERVKAYLLADNRLAELSETDDLQTLALLDEVKAYDTEMVSAVGWSQDELDELIRQVSPEMREPGEDGEGDGGEPSDGSLLALLDVTLDEPRNEVQSGQIWRVGRHVLICADVVTDWDQWTPFLKGEGVLFAPYPGPFVPLSLRAEKYRLVMVQPDKYIAGHILDRFEEIHGDGSVTVQD